MAEASEEPAAGNASIPLPHGQYAILVESQPSGATVVVDGIPVGRAPHRVLVAGTSLGYFQGAMSIKVRFVATDANGISQTVEEALTPRDRIPAALVFTPAGAQRRLR
ncbi:MAG TPA: PEGA domain-containing protein [Opitutaceae bacterium]